MNKRQRKKREYSPMYFGDTYNNLRKTHRKQHEASIALARKEHRNFWEEWKRGYPNRFPYDKWFNSVKV